MNTLDAKQLFARLELLRGILALYVVINHARGHLYVGFGTDVPTTLGDIPYLHYINVLTSLGQEAVLVFFVLSGFSIAHSVANTCSSREFWLRRVVRIYPPYLAGLAFGVACALILLHYGSQPWAARYEYRTLLDVRYLLSNLFYLSDADPTRQFWSLTYEAVFYAMAPLLFWRGTFHFVAISAVAAIGVLFLTRPAVDGHFVLSYLRYNMFFALGALLYAVTFTSSFPRIRSWLSAFDASTLAIKVMVTGATLVLMLPLYHLKLRVGGYSATELLALPLAVFAINIAIQTKAAPPYLSWLGSRSYSIYVTHLAAIIALEALLYGVLGLPYPTTRPFLWLIGVPIALIASEITYQVAERPSMELLRRLRSTKIEARSA